MSDFRLNHQSQFQQGQVVQELNAGRQLGYIGIIHDSAGPQFDYSTAL